MAETVTEPAACPRPDKRLRFNTEAFAEAAAKTINFQTGKQLRPYRCRCGQYHLTSWPESRKPVPVKTNNVKLNPARTPLAPQEVPLDNHPTTSQYIITAGVAEHWLEANTHNRAVRERYVETLAAAMNRGEWVENGDAIRFSTDGVLLDGQHRLAAVVHSGRPINAFVTTGLTPESQITMDTGSRRTFADVLKLAGHPNSITLAALATRVYKWDSGQVRSNLYRPTHAQLLSIIDRYPQLPDALTYGSRIYNAVKLTQSVGAFSWWLFSAVDEADAEVFVDRLVDGAGLQEGAPILALRRTLLSNSQARAKQPDFVLIALMIKAWNAYRDGREVKLLVWKSGGATPEAFPEPV